MVHGGAAGGDDFDAEVGGNADAVLVAEQVRSILGDEDDVGTTDVEVAEEGVDIADESTEIVLDDMVPITSGRALDRYSRGRMRNAGLTLISPWTSSRRTLGSSLSMRYWRAVDWRAEGHARTPRSQLALYHTWLRSRVGGCW